MLPFSRILFSIFQSTSPVRGTTDVVAGMDAYVLFQSTSPVRGTTRTGHKSDHQSGISIHVPREGDDPTVNVTVNVIILFQSTSPVRGTTLRPVPQADALRDFNPRPP